jgi:hypothetical protein
MFQTRELSPQPPILHVLPDDIEFNILSKLPVKSILRFRCVCKSWESSIITSTSFISTHLKLNNNNTRHDRLLYLSSPDSVTVTGERTFDRISEFKLPLDLVYARIVGSCNGLLCFSWNYPHNPHAYLCNPSIRKFQKVPDTASSISTTTLSSEL